MRRDPNHFADRVVFLVCLLGVLVFYTQAVHDLGFNRGRAEPKKCAEVHGKQVVSTTAEVCTYANAFGRSVIKRKAI